MNESIDPSVPISPNRRQLRSEQKGTDWLYRNIDKRFNCDRIPHSTEPLHFKNEHYDSNRLRIEAEDGRSLNLEDALAYLHADSLVVLKSGTLVVERYYSGIGPDIPHLLFSASKPFAAALVVNLIKDGLIKSEDTDIRDYLPELEETAFGGVTICHLLDMQSGIDMRDLDDLGELERSTGFAQPHNDESINTLVLKLRSRKFKPGTRTDYQSINTDLLSLLATHVSGKSASELLGKYVFDPMGAEFTSLLVKDQAGINTLSGGLAVCARDLAKFGLALLNDGEINKRQVLPSVFVDHIFQTAEPEKWTGSWIAQLTPQAKAYRAQLYLAADKFDSGAYFAVGNYGNALYIQPCTKVVIALQCSYPSPVDLPRFNTMMHLLRDLARID